MVTKAQTKPAAAPAWDSGERAAWAPPRRMKPSEWAEAHYRLRRGAYRGPWRNANAPQLQGIMDIASRPGVVQANLQKPGQSGGSSVTRCMTGYYADVDPAPMGLTLPNRDKGRKIVKTDVLPMFWHTPSLRALMGRPGREVLIESITLLNGFSLALMWSGSATSMASDPLRGVFNDEVNKFEAWTGEEPDAIAATETRLTSYGDRRLQFNNSTPTTTAGTISQLVEASTVKLVYQVPCPHCGKHQVLRWVRLMWLDLDRTNACLRAAAEAATAGKLEYLADGSRYAFGSPAELAAEIGWLEHWRGRLEKVEGRRGLADLLSSERERALWYQCEHCEGRIYHRQKAAMVRAGRWTTAEGFVTDFWGEKHEDAETVERWPQETRIGFQFSAMICLWIHWGLLANEWLRAQGNPAALFFFVTNRLAEAFEFRGKRLPETVFSAKCQADRGALPEGIVPRWAWVLTATVDTQVEGFYVVIRAWGSGMRSARVWHGPLADFAGIDHLIFGTQWPVEDGAYPPMTVRLTLIDSGGTADQVLAASRTQQVYQYVIPRQPYVVAIKGANRPGFSLYWPMRNPMSKGGRVDATDLRALMVDTHRANDLLSELILQGVPQRKEAGSQAAPVEAWMLNRRSDPVYNQHMAAVQRTVDPRTRVEMWTPRAPGVRHDYRDCEAYQIVAASLVKIHLLPDEAQLLAWKQQAAAVAQGPARQESPTGGETWKPTPL